MKVQQKSRGPSHFLGASASFALSSLCGRPSEGQQGVGSAPHPHPCEEGDGVGVQAWVRHCRLCSGLLEKQQPRKEHVTPLRREAEIRRGIDLSAASKRIQALPVMAVDQRLCRECSLCPALPPLWARGGGRNLTPHHAEAFLQASMQTGETPSLPARVPQQLPGAEIQIPCQPFLQAAQPEARSEGTDTILLAQTRNRGMESLSHELGPLGNPHSQGIRPQKFPCLMAEVGSSSGAASSPSLCRSQKG